MVLMDKYISYIDPRQNMRGFIIGIIILAGFGMAAGAAVVTTQPPRQASIEEISTERFSSPNVFIYSYWAGDKSEVKSFDLSNGQEITLATLPLNIKHINLLSSNEIIYINDTDDKDHGSQIIVRTIPDGQETIAVQANSDVRIDDYRVSPNGQYVATWEVALPPDSEQFFNGTSRVYVTNIKTGVKNQIYSEVANIPVHYPIAVTNDGRVFMDTFLPNDNAGWAYGMSVSDFSGTNKQDLGAVANGSYGSQPELSPDGSMLVFAGYDGSKGAGTELVNDVRRAILSSNTVDILDLNTLSRRRLPNLSSDNYYSRAWWDSINGNVLVSLSSKTAGETGTYSYSLSTNMSEKIIADNLSSIATGPQKVIAILGGGITLVGNITTSESTLGNLGGHYEQVLDRVYIVNESENDVISLDITNGFIQTITVKPSAYFSGTTILSTANSNTDASGGIKGKSPEQLQLQTFTIKPTLAPARNEQQSGARCRDVAAAACNELLGTNYTGDEARSGQAAEPPEYGACFQEQFAAAQSAGCANSPLYLYGERGTSINVKVGTAVFNSNAPHTPIAGYSGVLTGDGGIEIDSINYSSLDFDYNLGSKYAVPTAGYMVERKDFDKKLSQYAKNLGMNKKETSDFIQYVKTETKSNKIFISHFSNAISKKLLPLYFIPNPDSYTNIVFYVNDSGTINTNNPEEPEFEKIKRSGFTAVEISYIVIR
jgi:hypothetical protein